MRRLLLTLALCLALPLGAQEARFRIERIEVRDVSRVSPQLIRAESQLEEGETYGEAQLRNANHRLRRLPYILDVQFSLEKGSVRDSYVLVIKVHETKPFFYGVDFTVYQKHQDNVLLDAENSALVGVRFFAGPRGVVHAGLVQLSDDREYTEDYGVVQIGYTHYDILSSRAFVTLTANWVDEIGSASEVRPGVVTGIPLTHTQTITASYSDLRLRSGLNGKAIQRVIDVRWAYNTTDHPYLPTTGNYLSAGFGSADISASDSERRARAIEVRAAHYFPLGERYAVGLEARGAVEKKESRAFAGDFDGTDPSGAAVIRLSRWLRRGSSIGEADSRVELAARASSEQDIDPRLGRVFSQRVSLSWVYRDAWGTVRLGAGYAW